jgi:hypothetical protein
MFKRRSRAASREHEHFFGPQDGYGPLDCVALGMAATMNVTFAVHPQVRNGDYFGREWKDDPAWQDQTVKFQIHPSFANEVSRVTIVLETAGQVGPPVGDRMPKSRKRAGMAEYRIAQFGSARREVWLV